MPSPFLLDTPSEPRRSSPDQNRKRVLLIVDDEEGPRQSIRIVFKEEYQILMANDGLQAMEHARNQTVDAAVLDIRMFGLSGIDLLKRLKEIDPAIEVVMLTAYETLETARQALRLGACDYLTKPFDIATLRNAVSTAMQRRAISDEIRSNNEKLKRLQTEIHHQQLREENARTRGEIYASILHDINGPITIISAYIEIINQRITNACKIEGEDLAIIRDRLARMTRQVSNCIDISRRYLSFLRGERADMTEMSVNQVLNDLRELLKVHPHARPHQLTVRLLEKDICTQMNATDLIQILMNLTINALQSTAQSHRVEVQARLLAEPLPLADLKEGLQDRILNQEAFPNQAPLLAFSVEDDGPGIPPEIMIRIFEPYFTTKPPGQGTGLGLSIVRRLVEQSKGLIQVHSEPGRRTLFSVYLPMAGGAPSS
ncbi:MAG: response regulator [Chloroflexi bacterium]|nr:response regulator [Chloroflexota bacterium]